MFTKNTFYMVEFAVTPGFGEAARKVVRTEVLSAMRDNGSNVEECVWFQSDDGSTLFQFASFRSPGAAIAHHELTTGARRPPAFAALGEVRRFRIVGGGPEGGHPLFADHQTHFTEICRHQHDGHFATGRNLFYVLELACEARHAEAIERMMASDFTPRVKRADPDVEDYVWFVNDRRDRFLQFASYATAEGVLNHYRTSNGTERVARLFELCQLEHTRIFGPMTSELRELYAPPMWTHFTELARLQVLSSGNGVDVKDFGQS